MRIYCWDYGSHDAVPYEYKKHSLILEEDNVKEDDIYITILLCGYCKKKIRLYKDTESCPHCGKDLVFPRAEW